jgi:hypothetical protein
MYDCYLSQHCIYNDSEVKKRPILYQRDEGWAEEWLYFHQTAPEYLKWDISATTYWIFLKFETKACGTKPILKIA